MLKADIIYLVKESPEAHGVFDSPTESNRMVYCTVRSIGMTEAYKAKEANINPSYVFDLADYSDYEGEKIVIYNSKRYAVVRTYVAGQRIEITVEEASNDR